jgi:hypothetical protein
VRAVCVPPAGGRKSRSRFLRCASE